MAEGSYGVPSGRRPAGQAVSYWWSGTDNGYLIRTSGVYSLQTKMFLRTTLVNLPSFEVKVRFRAKFNDGRVETLWENRQFKSAAEDTINIAMGDTENLNQDTIVTVEIWANIPGVVGSTTHGLVLQDSLANPMSLFKIHLVN